MHQFKGAGWDDLADGWAAFGFVLKSVRVCSIVLIVVNKM
jgi:hypothetical protein